jgi:hypothetical protein
MMSSALHTLTQRFSQLSVSGEEQDAPDGIADGLDKEFEQILALKEGIPTAENVRNEVYYMLTKQFPETLPLIPLERDGRRPINVFSLGQFSKGEFDMFSITGDWPRGMTLYLNVRIKNPPPIGVTFGGVNGPDETDIPLTLDLMSGSAPQYGIQRKRTDRSGRTVFQFPFCVGRDTANRILDVIHDLLCCFELQVQL